MPTVTADPRPLHPDADAFPSCPFGPQGGRLPGGRVRRHNGDRFCNDPEPHFCPGKSHLQWTPKADDETACEHCNQPKAAHYKKALVVLADCAACKWANFNGPLPPIAPKVGDVLARILKDRRNANASETCDCAAHITEMNNWGPDGCEENLETIVGWLLQAASDTPGIHRWIPEFVKAPILEGDVRDAIKEVREWQPPTAPTASEATGTSTTS